MKLIVRPSKLSGGLAIPGSKSHTIRALGIALLAQGTSKIANFLKSDDTNACIAACRSLGARIQEDNELLIIDGVGGTPVPNGQVINVMNSGTTLRFMAGIATLANSTVTFDGDDQIRRRPMQPLLSSLNKLGAECSSLHNNGSCPFTVMGQLQGGQTIIDGITSQYLSSLLLCTPLAPQDSVIRVNKLQERPYIDMTLDWLTRQGIVYKTDIPYEKYTITGRQSYHGFERTIPGDFSSATFPLAAAAISSSSLLVTGLDCNDSQGDKKIIPILEALGAGVGIQNKSISIEAQKLKGMEIDCNDTPDAVPALAVVGCCAEGETVLSNVPQARIKETDRIATMCKELGKMGAQIEELEAGLKIKKSSLQGCTVNGHNDHRVVMALSLAGLVAEGETIIETAEALSVTFPDYVELMQSVGAAIELVA